MRLHDLPTFTTAATIYHELTTHDIATLTLANTHLIYEFHVHVTYLYNFQVA